jgi:hypothetical protein
MQWQHRAFKRMNVGDSVMTPSDVESEAEVNLSEDMQVILKYNVCNLIYEIR